MARTYLSVRGYITSDPKVIYDRLSRKEALFFCVGFSVVREGKRYQVRYKAVIKDKELIERARFHLVKGSILRLKGYNQYIKLYKGSAKFIVLNVRLIKVLFSSSLLKHITIQEIRTFNTIHNPKTKDQANNVIDSIKRLNKGFYLKGMVKVNKTAKERASEMLTSMQLTKGLAHRYYLENNKYMALAYLNLVKYIYYFLIPSHYKKEIHNKYSHLISYNFASYLQTQ